MNCGFRRRSRWATGGVLAWLFAATVIAAPTSTATFTATTTPALRINEVLAANTKIPNGSLYPDLIELYNAGPTSVDLAGKSLTDDPALPRKYVFPPGTSIAAGAFLIVYADDATSIPGLHTDFALDAEGDQVRLYDTPDNGGGLIDSIAFGFQVPDASISRTSAAANIWALTPPTPGEANASPTPLGNVGGLKLNEWAGKITFRLDHDLIELFNPAAQPVAIGSVRLTDNISQPTRFVFPVLSFVSAGGYLPLYGADFVFGLDGDLETISLLGENNEAIDQVTVIAQPVDQSAGRIPDGSASVISLNLPTPGISNSSVLPPAYASLLANLRITELMYQPSALSNASQYEFIELQNIGSTVLDLSGVRFTNGLDYVFPSGSVLAPGAFIVVVNDRSSFLSRYPGAASVMAPGGFNGSLDNTGETVALTLPAPWDVHILRFRFEPTWYSSASGGGHSIVPVSPASTPAQNWKDRLTWRASAAVNGSPGTADPGTSNPPSNVTARLANLSVRTALAADQILIVGFVVQGGSRDILIRAAGPALAAFVPDPMADPRLELFRDSTSLFVNDDWPAALAPVFTSVAAFAFEPGSRDAAMVVGIDGSRTVQARGPSAGIILVEAYDTGAVISPRLVNVSARNRVGLGDNLLIAGFTIVGTDAKSLLIRAVGPKLAAFNVPDFLVDPKLELYDKFGTKLSENDNWNSTIAPAAEAVGAFALDAGSRDAALLTSLAPGPYTVQVRGADGGTGEALVEIYEVR